MIVGAGKNGMELYKVMKDDLSYGFNILGFFDDNLSLKSVLPNYLGMTSDVESFVCANDWTRSIVHCRVRMMPRSCIC